jgi:hypothetical protein
MNNNSASHWFARFFGFFLVLILPLFSSCRLSSLNPTNAIPVFNLSSSGQIKSHLVPRDEYKKNVISHFASIEKETSSVLNKEANYSHSTKFRPVQVIVGLAISLELGFSPVYALAIQPTFQLWFRNIDVWN